ncbi:hypothetical protein SeMB42_g07555 [Synchytrium endobioticum]|uniref:Uncharacterized protein n=1 Tax=Synchytrium endobioticum TaxID=286115 RepID=A0A507BZS6_9FUNG|nr:hypothetical protein SeMB42_g07555 [Synchytrium endobioticum]
MKPVTYCCVLCPIQFSLDRTIRAGNRLYKHREYSLIPTLFHLFLDVERLFRRHENREKLTYESIGVLAHASYHVACLDCIAVTIDFVLTTSGRRVARTHRPESVLENRPDLAAFA